MRPNICIRYITVLLRTLLQKLSVTSLGSESKAGRGALAFEFRVGGHDDAHDHPCTSGLNPSRLRARNTNHGTLAEKLSCIREQTVVRTEQAKRAAENLDDQDLDEEVGILRVRQSAPTTGDADAHSA